MSPPAFPRLSSGRRSGSDHPAPMAATFIEPAGTWAGPFVMEGCNGRIVHLSNALAKEHYGSDFKYTEMIKTGSGWKGWAGAWAVATGMIAIGISFAFSPVRAFAKM